MTNQPTKPTTDMVQMTAMAASHMVASAISGVSRPVVIEHAGYTALVSSREFNELSWVDVNGQRPLWATVTIISPDDVEASVSHSSSSSRGELADVAATTRVLAFAVEVAEQLNRWAA
jgi:hypothetical protein